MQNDIYGGKYTAEEIKEILEINARPHAVTKPFNPFYRKTGSEYGPTWQQKKEVQLLTSLNSFIVCSLVDPRIPHLCSI